MSKANRFLAELALLGLPYTHAFLAEVRARFAAETERGLTPVALLGIVLVVHRKSDGGASNEHWRPVSSRGAMPGARGPRTGEPTSSSPVTPPQKICGTSLRLRRSQVTKPKPSNCCATPS
jgi:hypothetical protein